MVSSHCVLSCFVEYSPAVLENHRRYAAQHGYTHVHVDAAMGPRGARLQALRRYESLLHALERCALDAIVLLLGENSAVVGFQPLERLMAGRDALLVSIDGEVPQTDVQFWRNTPTARERVYRIAQRCKLGGEPFEKECEILGGEPMHPWNILIDGLCAVMNTGPNIDPYWSRTPTFSICLNGLRQSPPEMGTVPRFREMLSDHIDTCRKHNQSPFTFDYPVAEWDAARRICSPGRPIAFIMLYTPEIAVYGRLAERNLTQYCERHGYTLYVHREVPEEIGLSGTGNWFKPWLLHAYMEHHEWVIWVDADVLVLDHNRPIDDLLSNRTALLARDIGQWPFNSGVMGFRHTPENSHMLQELMANITALPDRSTVYAHNGDQYYFIEAMRQTDMLDESAIFNPLVFNTPWFMVGADSFLVHYYGMWTEMRAMVMAYDEARRTGGALMLATSGTGTDE